MKPNECEKFFELIPLMVSGDLGADEEKSLKRHLAECGKCSGVLSQTEETAALLKEFPVAQLTNDEVKEFAIEVRARAGSLSRRGLPAPRKVKPNTRDTSAGWKQYRERMVRRRRRTVIAAIAAAAVVVAITVIIVAFSGSPQAPEVEKPHIADVPDERPAPQPLVPVPPAPDIPVPEPEPEKPVAPPATEVILAGKLDWLKDTKVISAPEPGEGIISFAREAYGKGPTGPGPGRGHGAKGSKRPSTPQEEIESFIKHFDFKFRVPRMIIAGYELRSGKAVSKEKLWLLFEKDKEILTVFLACLPGEDTDFVEIVVGDLSLLAARKSGILIGFEGLPEEAEVETLTKLFLSEKAKEEGNE